MTSGTWVITECCPGVLSVEQPYTLSAAAEMPGELAPLLDDAPPHRVVLAEDVQGWSQTGDASSAAALAARTEPVVATAGGGTSIYGLTILLAADIRIVADDFMVSLHDDGAVLTDARLLTRIAWLIGAGTASFWILARRTITAREALAAGLVDAVVTRGDLIHSARALAAEVGLGAPLALKYAKEAIRRGVDMSLPQALELEADLYTILQTTEDRREGVDGFLARRAPRFTGR